MVTEGRTDGANLREPLFTSKFLECGLLRRRLVSYGHELLVPQCNKGIDFGCAAGWNVAGNACDQDQRDRNREIS